MTFRIRAAVVCLLVSCALAHVARASNTSPPPTTRPATVKVAAVQCSSDLGDVKANTRKLTKLVEEAAAHGAKIIVLPEAAITGYLSQDLQTNWRFPGRPMDPTFKHAIDPMHAAELVPGASTDHFAKLAKRLGVYITIPLVE